MRICYFGDHDASFGRSYAIHSGLKLAGADIVECYSNKKGIAFYVDLYKKLKSLKNDYDVIFIGNSGPSYFLPLWAKIISKKKVVWEPLFSIYDNYIYDRKVAPRWSLKALYYFLMDWVGVKASDLVVLDTLSNVAYFKEKFGGGDKYTVALSGPNTDVFYPQNNIVTDDDIFEVEYHGKYIPVQGTDVIVEAAYLLRNEENIHFTMIGGGQMYADTKVRADKYNLKNITFLSFMPTYEIVSYIARADVCLGLLGDVPRVHRAIPNKLYEAAAMKKVSINADTQVLREVFTPGVDVVTVLKGSPQSLADTIVSLKKSKTNVQAMGQKAWETLNKKATIEIIGKKLHNDIKNLFPDNS